MRFLSLELLPFACVSKCILSKKLIVCFASGECVLVKSYSAIIDRTSPFNVETTPVSLKNLPYHSILDFFLHSFYNHSSYH